MKSFFFILIFTLVTPVCQSRVLEEKQSLYQKIYITKEKSIVCMSFRSPSWGVLEQSCYNSRKPDKLIFDYYQAIALFTTFIPKRKQSILVLGLGGGVIPKFLAENFPESTIDTVELDPIVVAMAKKYFNYKENTRVRTHIVDGRVFVKRAILKKKKYDLIILDAFGGDYIPEHMMTKEFLLEVKKILSGEGFLIANTFSDSKLYDYESETYHQVFGKFYQLQVSKEETNRVIVTSKQGLMRLEEKLNKRSVDDNELKKYGVKFLELLNKIDKTPAWDKNTKPLTDQYSPANLLKTF